MDYNLYFDVAAIVLFAAMIFTVVYRKTITQASGKFFLILLVLGLVSGISDILSVMKNLGTIPVYIANVIFIGAQAFSSFCFTCYIIGVTDCWHKFYHKFFYKLLLCIPFLTVFGFLIANYWNGWVFHVVDGVYSRGLLINYGLLYGNALIYFIIALVYILVYHEFFTKIKLFALISIYPIAVVALLIQSLLPEQLVEIFFTSIACLMVMNIIERPEEYFEIEIGLLKYTAFAEDAYKAMVTKEKASLIFVKIVNEQALNSKMTYEEQIDIRKTIGKIIKETAKDFSMSGKYYWLGNGQYAAVLKNEKHENSESFAMTVRRRLNVPVKTTFGIVDLYSNVALVNCPKDINTSDMSISFIENFYHVSGVLDSVLDLSMIPNKKDFEIKMNMQSIIKRALMKNNFEVYFQPIYSMKDKAFVSAEALLRLKDDKYGFIAPNLFLPEAERSGTIHKIGDIVFDRVCKFISSSDFKKCGLEYIEVNLSVVQCMHEDLPIHLMDAVKRYGVNPKNINLDITETADAYSHKMMEENIKVLKELGFTFSLDDYGQGYSNMDNVTNLPIDVIKIDKALTGNDNPNMRVMMDHSIKMIKDLKRKIVVEGVETEEMLNSFEGYLCDYIQGFYFSKPLPEGDFVSFLLEQKDGSKKPEVKPVEETSSEVEVKTEEKALEPEALESAEEKAEEPVEVVAEEPVKETLEDTKEAPKKEEPKKKTMTQRTTNSTKTKAKKSTTKNSFTKKNISKNIEKVDKPKE